MDIVYVGVIIERDRKILAISRNKEKVSHAIYKFFIHEENIFTRIWSSYHSIDHETFRSQFPEMYNIYRFENRMGLHSRDDEYNEEFFNELIELPTIERYINEWGIHRFEIEEHELLST